MDKRIDHKAIGKKWQSKWEKQTCPVPDERIKFSIVMPPVNVTGILHLGHMLNNLIQDLVVRYEKSKGKNVIWIPGLDHAGIATQSKVEQMLKGKGLTKHDLGREKFIEETFRWKEQYGGIIIDQLKQIGSSCNWDKLKFTMDADYSKHVTDVFVKLYNDGLIYKGNYMVNWCTTLQTAISDEECLIADEEVKMYHIAYQFENNNVDEQTHLVIATTRPETIFGDVAVAFNPDDERYKKYIGLKLIVPIAGKTVELIADSNIKTDAGTGLVKITPAHDKTDYEIGKTHNLDIISIIDKTGCICDTGTRYDGMFRDKARREILKELTELGALKNTVSKQSSVSRCYRSNSIIEPMITKQWFIKMKPLVKYADDMLKRGDVEFYPKRTENIFNTWSENIKDWCISRQLWWGHQIPIWYCSDGHETCNDTLPTSCRCGCTKLTQDPDCLDTWNSSWLWAFAVFSETEFEYYFPTDLLVTGVDILFFWVMKMMMISGYLFGKPPFKKVYFHGIIRDEINKKMSKSLGNVINPLDLIDKFGVDPVRFSLLMIMPKDGDLKISPKQIDIGKTFCTKLWNVARYLELNDVFSSELNESTILNLEHPNDTDIYNDLQKLKINVDDCYNKFDFQRLAQSLYTFVWDKFANGYLEFCKDKLSPSNKQLLMYIFKEIIKLLHPVIPHIASELEEKLLLTP
jgi:valyl-tRNA synthetase